MKRFVQNYKAMRKHVDSCKKPYSTKPPLLRRTPLIMLDQARASTTM